MDNFLRSIDTAIEFIGGVVVLGSLVFIAYAICIVAR
jgi:hypothetical protein